MDSKLKASTATATATKTNASAAGVDTQSLKSGAAPATAPIVSQNDDDDEVSMCGWAFYVESRRIWDESGNVTDSLLSRAQRDTSTHSSECEYYTTVYYVSVWHICAQIRTGERILRTEHSASLIPFIRHVRETVLGWWIIIWVWNGQHTVANAMIITRGSRTARWI